MHSDAQVLDEPPRGALAPNDSWGSLSDAATERARSQAGSPAPTEEPAAKAVEALQACAAPAPAATARAPLARAVTVQLPLTGAPRRAWLWRTKSEGALPWGWGWWDWDGLDES